MAQQQRLSGFVYIVAAADCASGVCAVAHGLLPQPLTPLEREIRVSSSLEQIEAYWQEWQREQFVKGWVVR